MIGEFLRVLGGVFGGWIWSKSQSDFGRDSPNETSHWMIRVLTRRLVLSTTQLHTDPFTIRSEKCARVLCHPTDPGEGDDQKPIIRVEFPQEVDGRSR